MFRMSILLLLLAPLFSCAQQERTHQASSPSRSSQPDVIMEWDGRVIDLSEEAWRAALSPELYRVARQHQTERAFTGTMHREKRSGNYACSACGLILFSSASKFDSGTGWPSFYEPSQARHIGEQVDNSYGMKRTEVHCARCKSHLGHVFEDGPRPTGLRYCINAVSLIFFPEGE
jgi:peptide-methionine (R)-S-oxide reductase